MKAQTETKDLTLHEKDPYLVFLDSILSPDKKFRSPLRNRLFLSKTYKTKKPYLLKNKKLLPLRDKLSDLLEELELEILHTSNLDVTGEYLCGEDLILLHPLSEYSSEGTYLQTLAHECAHALMSVHYGEMVQTPLFRKQKKVSSLFEKGNLAHYAEEFFSETFSYLLCQDYVSVRERQNSEIYLKDYFGLIQVSSKTTLNNDEIVKKLYRLAKLFLKKYNLTSSRTNPNF